MTDRYANRRGTLRPSYRGATVDPDVPQAGCYRVRLRSGAPWSAIRIWLGFPTDPETGEEMTERPYNWRCELNGSPVDLHSYWPGCAREPLSREEHDRIVALNRDMNPESPFFDPLRKIDLNSAPPPF